MARQRFEMTEAQLNALLEASKPVPFMIVGGVIPRGPQENANEAWQALAAELGFVWNTVEPVEGEGFGVFTAETTDRKEKAGEGNLV